MYGILLMLAAAASSELGTSIGKTEAGHRKEGIYTMGFLNVFWGAVFMLIYGLFSPDGFVFAWASLPTVAVRGVLEVLQAYVSVRAIVEADRSTFGFLRTATIPLLLAVDMALGYPLLRHQVFGIGLIAVAMLVLFMNHGIRKKGAIWVAISAGNAVTTISLYKYHISNFNSVAAEQTIFLVLLIVFFLVMSWRSERARPWRLLWRRPFVWQSAACGLGVGLASLAYLFAAASVITAAKRSFEVLAAIVSGNVYFREKNLLVKLAVFVLIVAGLFLLA